MNKIIENGLDSIGISRTGIKIQFLTQSCFPIYLIHTNNHKPLVAKILDQEEMAISEVSSLRFLQSKNCFVPTVHGLYTEKNNSLLFMDYISDNNTRNKKDKLIDSLKTLYSNQSEKWGFGEDNFIGPLPQHNQYYNSFDSFFLESRILPQLKLCLDKKIFDLEFVKKIEKQILKLVHKWELGKKDARLIHGDLWSGNIVFADKAYFIDPSISYSHPEQDLAMLELFGSPLNTSDLNQFLNELGYDFGFDERVLFWQLYPLLVHVNLFGGSYINQFYKAIDYYN